MKDKLRLLKGKLLKANIPEVNSYLSAKENNLLLPEKIRNTTKEVIDLVTELKLSRKTVLSIVMQNNLRRFISRVEYTTKPTREGRDNKLVKSGGGGSNQNKIRYPRKVRKTAWKRFYKLFPHLKPTEA